MKVLIIEDDPLHRSYLHEAVRAALPECDTVLEAGNGYIGEVQARQSRAEHVVMDLQMNERNGIEAARTIWRERPDTKILFWSNYSDEAYVRGVARIVPEGATYGYVLKSTSDERLKLALRGVFMESQCVIDREVRGVQQKSLGTAHGLSDAEYEILLDVALGLTDKAIAQRKNSRCEASRTAFSSSMKNWTSTRSRVMGPRAGTICACEQSPWRCSARY